MDNVSAAAPPPPPEEQCEDEGAVGRMGSASAGAVTASRFDYYPVAPARPVPDLAADLLHGFALSPRRLPPKYFYDAVGSQLFDRICDTPEYYPTRSEAVLLAEHAGELLGLVRPCHLIELGSGSSRKTRLLLQAAGQLDLELVYWPFDVCHDMLERTGRALIDEFPGLRVRALGGDYMGGLSHLPRPPGRRLFVFLGGTIGNFDVLEAHRFLCDLRAQMQSEDRLLLGADRAKDAAVLEAAYNDAAGVTAAFNLNLLRVINRELRADFDLDGFRHRALFNRAESRIEMHLVAQTRQQVRVAALERVYRFEPGEPILTEISRKFTQTMLQTMLERAGFAIERHIEGGEQLFSLLLVRPAGA